MKNSEIKERLSKINFELLDYKTLSMNPETKALIEAEAASHTAISGGKRSTFIAGATFGYELKKEMPEIDGDVIERFMTWIDNFATWHGSDWGVVNVTERFTHKALFNFYKDQISKP